MGMRSGVRLALDLGARRIGVARCDREAIMAVPVGTLDAAAADWVQQVVALVQEHEPMELVIGDPLSLRGTSDVASQSVRDRAVLLSQALPGLPIRLVDERLTTAAAQRQLHGAGRDVRSSREVIDVQAAVGILEFALEYERRTGQPAGETAGDGA